MFMSYVFLITVLILALCNTVTGIRCYECSHVPSPAVCHDVTVCNNDDHCYVEEFITSSGRVVFNSGCRNKNTCALDVSGVNINGRSVRSTELLVCSQCCQDDFCNLRGCGKTDRPRHERGPYCFDCSYMISPDVCDRVSLCQVHEQCSVYVPPDYNLYPTQYYSAGCQSNNTCNTRLTIGANISCPPMCCTDDHCNSKCGTPSTSPTMLPTNPVQASLSTATSTLKTTPHQTTGTLQTTPPQTTGTLKTTPPQTTGTLNTTSPLMTVTTTVTIQSTNPSTMGPVHCNDGYHWVHVHHENICIKVSDIRLPWGAARTACQVERGDLIVIDTHEKLDGMKEYMKIWTQNHPNKHHELLWIGLYDKENDGRLDWVDGSPVRHDTIHWQHHEEPKPPHGSHDPHGSAPNHPSNSCVQMETHGELHFGTSNCIDSWHFFICERKIN